MISRWKRTSSMTESKLRLKYFKCREPNTYKASGVNREKKSETKK
jgi:hypothetical protein